MMGEAIGSRRKFGTLTGQFMHKPANLVSPHEALIYAMVTLAAADRAMTDNELMKIGDIVKTLPIFRDFDKEHLVKAAEACGAILQKEEGLDEILDVIANTLVPRVYETAYALAVE